VPILIHIPCLNKNNTIIQIHDIIQEEICELEILLKIYSVDIKLINLFYKSYFNIHATFNKTWLIDELEKNILEELKYFDENAIQLFRNNKIIGVFFVPEFTKIFKYVDTFITKMLKSETNNVYILALFIAKNLSRLYDALPSTIKYFINIVIQKAKYIGLAHKIDNILISLLFINIFSPLIINPKLTAIKSDLNNLEILKASFKIIQNNANSIVSNNIELTNTHKINYIEIRIKSEIFLLCEHITTTKDILAFSQLHIDHNKIIELCDIIYDNKKLLNDVNEHNIVKIKKSIEHGMNVMFENISEFDVDPFIANTSQWRKN
jgi:hypothetical protein